MLLGIPNFRSNLITPTKTNMDTQNSHIWKEITFKTPSYIGIFIRFRGGYSFLVISGVDMSYPGCKRQIRIWSFFFCKWLGALLIFTIHDCMKRDRNFIQCKTYRIRPGHIDGGYTTVTNFKQICTSQIAFYNILSDVVLGVKNPNMCTKVSPAHTTCGLMLL